MNLFSFDREIRLHKNRRELLKALDQPEYFSIRLYKQNGDVPGISFFLSYEDAVEAAREFFWKHDSKSQVAISKPKRSKYAYVARLRKGEEALPKMSWHKEGSPAQAIREHFKVGAIRRNQLADLFFPVEDRSQK